MSDTTVAPANPNQLRQQLMRVGGTFTMIMANNGILPEAVAEHVSLPLDLVLATMTGTANDIQLSQLSQIAQALGAQIVVAAAVKQPRKVDDVVAATPVAPAIPEVTAAPAEAPAAS